MSRAGLAAAVLIFAAPNAEATEIVLHGLSYHAPRYWMDRSGTRRQYDEQHFGIGFAVARPAGLVQVGFVDRNSFGVPMVYAIRQATPWHAFGARFGAFAGVATGYRRPLVGGAAVRWEGNGAAVTLRVAPKRNPDGAAFALELAIRI